MRQTRIIKLVPPLSFRSPPSLSRSGQAGQPPQAGQSGQAGIITLLTLVALLTIGLSLGTRTTQDLSLSRQQAESSRVFNAAEAGIEDALSQINTSGSYSAGTTNIDVENTTVDVSVTEQARFDSFVFENSAIEINVTGGGAGNNIRLDWDTTDDCSSDNPASLVVSIFYLDTAARAGDDTGGWRVEHQGIGSCSRGDNFEQAAQTNGELKWRWGLLLPDNSQFVRIRPVYNDTRLQVVAIGGWTLPAQGFKVRSEASNDLGDEVRIVEVDRSLETSPTIFDFALFGADDLSK